MGPAARVQSVSRFLKALNRNDTAEWLAAVIGVSQGQSVRSSQSNPWKRATSPNGSRALTKVFSTASSRP